MTETIFMHNQKLGIFSNFLKEKFFQGGIIGTRPYTRHKMRPRPALRHFQRFSRKRYGPTDQPTDRPTDGHNLL